MATVVGEKLASLGQRYQVLCITHLPQVAACGRTHFLIQKETRGRRTVTSVLKLGEDARIDELARMMGGADAGAHARATRQLLADYDAAVLFPTSRRWWRRPRAPSG